MSEETPKSLQDFLNEMGDAIIEIPVVDEGIPDMEMAALTGVMLMLGETLSREGMVEYIYGTMEQGLRKFAKDLYERDYAQVEEFCSAYLIVLTMFMAAVRKHQQLGDSGFIAKYGENGDIDHFFGKRYDFLDENEKRMEQGRKILKQANFSDGNLD